VPVSQVDDQNRQRNNQQQMNQDTAHMQAETQDPQDQEDSENDPQHVNLWVLTCEALNPETDCEDRPSGLTAPSDTNYLPSVAFALLCRIAHWMKMCAFPTSMQLIAFRPGTPEAGCIVSVADAGCQSRTQQLPLHSSANQGRHSHAVTSAFAALF
jgi:hypothetical protein